MRRREFFSFAAAGAVSAPHISEAKTETRIELIEKLVREEFPDAKLVQVIYDPTNARMPLAIQVFTI